MSIIYDSCIYCNKIFNIFHPHTCSDESGGNIDSSNNTHIGIYNGTTSIVTDSVSNINIFKEMEIPHAVPIFNDTYSSPLPHNLQHTHKSTNVSVSLPIQHTIYCVACGNKTVVNGGGDDGIKIDKTGNMLGNTPVAVGAGGGGGGNETPDLYKMFLQLEKKYDKLQKEIYNLKSASARRLRRDINDYLQHDLRAKCTFLDWVTSFVVNDEILQTVFNGTLMDGIKQCLNDRIQTEGVYSIPIRFFKEKQNDIFIFTDEITTDGDKDACTKKNANNAEILPIWKIVTKSYVDKIKENIEILVVKKFLEWHDICINSKKISDEKHELMLSYSQKVMETGSKARREKHTAELHKWMFDKLVQ
jgi:hypothetical protein